MSSLRLRRVLVDMNVRSIAAHVLKVILGVGATSIVLALLRAGYYKAVAIEANMAPQIFFFFLPAVIGVISVVAAAVETSVVAVNPVAARRSLFVGASYALPLVLLIELQLGVLCLLINPLTVRVFNRRSKGA
jgi:hypothetical protein